MIDTVTDLPYNIFTNQNLTPILAHITLPRERILRIDYSNRKEGYSILDLIVDIPVVHTEVGMLSMVKQQ